MSNANTRTNPFTRTHIELEAHELREYDLLADRVDSATWLVRQVKRVSGIVRVRVEHSATGKSLLFDLDPARPCTVVNHDGDPCESCNGRGWKPIGHGVIENGVFKGPTGKCFRCHGKGQQDRADRVRNAYYDNHVMRVSL